MAEEQRDGADHTEDPTQKKLDEALKRGDVAKSQEVNTWFVIAGATLILLAFSNRMADGLKTTLRGLIANSYDIPLDGPALLRMLGRLEAEVLAAVAIPFLLLTLAAILGNVAQHRLVWSAETLRPKLEKISPLAGFKRLFSKQALANFIKGLAKLALVGAVMTAAIWPQRARLQGLLTIDPAGILPVTRSWARRLGRRHRRAGAGRRRRFSLPISNLV
jgi:flagellar biosynthetic protein FlhB